MEYKDYYKILGVPKRREREGDQGRLPQLARKVPSRHEPGDKKAEARFKEINEANDVLSDTEKRKRYDELGADWAAYERPAPGRRSRRRPGRRPWHDASGGERLGGFSDFFRTFFWRRRRRRVRGRVPQARGRPPEGSDARAARSSSRSRRC